MENHDSEIMDAWASVEATLAWWASSLREVRRRMRRLFAQERMAAKVGLFPDGLLGDERRKTGVDARRGPPMILVHGASRQSLTASGGTLTRCVLDRIERRRPH